MILVFGKTGQLASALGHLTGVHCVGREEADLRDPESCADIIATTEATAIINAAAYTNVDQAETEAELAFAINAEAPAAMARAAARRGIPFVHVSTDYVFDGTGTIPWRETDPPAPTTTYGQSKLAGEMGIQAAGGIHAIVRTAWVISATGHNFLRTMLRLSESHDTLRVVNDQRGGPTPAADLAQTCLHLARHLTPETSGTYHYSGAPETTWAAFATEIFTQADRATTVTGIPSSEYPTPAKRPLNSVLDCRAIFTAFGLSQPDWRTGVRQILSELKEIP